MLYGLSAMFLNKQYRKKMLPHENSPPCNAAHSQIIMGSHIVITNSW